MFRSVVVRRGLNDPSRLSSLRETEVRVAHLVERPEFDLKHLRGARKIVIFLDHFF